MQHMKDQAHLREIGLEDVHNRRCNIEDARVRTVVDSQMQQLRYKDRGADSANRLPPLLLVMEERPDIREAKADTARDRLAGVATVEQAIRVHRHPSTAKARLRYFKVCGLRASDVSGHAQRENGGLIDGHVVLLLL